MADVTVERAADHTDVLLAYGEDLFPGGAEDAALIGALRSAVARASPSDSDALVSPVRRGTHDFWIVYTVGATGAPNAGGSDADATPRPLRGAVVAKSPPTTTDAGTIVQQLTTLLQEVGHYWLAYPSLKFVSGGRPVSYEVADWSRFNHDQPLTGPLLGGRLLQHWGPWFNSGNSPMGGRNWVTVSRDGVFDRWRWEPRSPGLQPRPPGLAAVTVDNKFCDLDLLVMGAKEPEQCYPATDGDFRYLEPTYVVQPRVLPGHPELDYPFFAGVFVAFGAEDFRYFGFDGDHRALGVYSTDRTRVTQPIDLGRGYTPGWPPNSGVALRVVRLGETLTFQARFDDSALGLRTSPSDHNVFVGPPSASVPGLFDGIPSLGVAASGRDFTTFRTVATVTESRAPTAVGIIAMTSWPTLLDAVFGPLETLTLPLLRFRGEALKREHKVHRLAPLPSRAPTTTSLGDLPAGQPRLHLPAGDLDPPSAQGWHGRLRLLLPYDLSETDGGVTFQHTEDVDRAPKVLLRPPGANFAFGTSVAVRRTLYARYSGGGAHGTEIWGRTRTLNARDVRPPDAHRQRREEPQGGQYRTAFVIAAHSRSDITDAMIESVDMVRRYWDPTFELATDGTRRSDSSLG